MDSITTFIVNYPSIHTTRRNTNLHRVEIDTPSLRVSIVGCRILLDFKLQRIDILSIRTLHGLSLPLFVSTSLMSLLTAHTVTYRKHRVNSI